MKCPICNEEMNLKEILKGKTNTPNILVNNEKNIEKVNIPFYVCSNCRHGMIENILNDDFYQEFSVAQIEETTLSKDSTRLKIFDKTIEKLKELNKDDESIIEIGSGCGYFLKRASEKYKYALGIEPSKTEAEFSKNMGLNIKNCYFSKDLNLEIKFSAFACTMVLEHIPSPKDVLIYAYEILKEKGVGVIQVPNAQRTQINSVYFDVYPQHLHYFTPLSLVKLVTDCGFEIISISEISDKNYLEIYIKKPQKIITFMNKENEDKKILNQTLNKYSSIGLWGASYAARSCVYLSENNKNIKYLFDMGKNKIGGFINGCDLKIEYPEVEKVKKCDLIFILANEYTQEIIKILKEIYKYQGDILIFDDSCELKLLKC